MRATGSHFHSLNYLPVLPENIIIFKLAVLDFYCNLIERKCNSVCQSTNHDLRRFNFAQSKYYFDEIGIKLSI